MEQGWIFLALALIIGFALLLVIADLYYAKKRIAKLESRVDDWDLWSDCVDNALDPVTAQKIKAAYVERKQQKLIATPWHKTRRMGS